MVKEIPEVSPIAELPPKIDTKWITEFRIALLEFSKKEPQKLKSWLRRDVCLGIIKQVEEILRLEPTLVEIIPRDKTTKIVVVGDTHGQLHDVCKMFEVSGEPSKELHYIINGDMVDRGAWGLETLLLFAVWKLAYPNHVFILRGNHETATCAIMYGFKSELEAKYGKTSGKSIFSACKKMFQFMPLAALVSRQTLILHGGIFREHRTGTKRKRKIQISGFSAGSLDTLRNGAKGGLDPSGYGSSQLASDVLWSDPAKEQGFSENEGRGIGMVFGPDITEEFLRSNNLKLIIRSHEGPDAREARPEMPSMQDGYTEDHVTPAGKLVTVFSAPDYPQFICADTERYRNKAAVIVLSAPDYSTPTIKQFEAVLPRPCVQPYYDIDDTPDSDEEFENLAPTTSGMSGVDEEYKI
eukprot:jgi/Picsp_1/5504/NSC_02863-R1_serine threonine-protein phosphatase 7